MAFIFVFQLFLSPSFASSNQKCSHSWELWRTASLAHCPLVVWVQHKRLLCQKCTELYFSCCKVARKVVSIQKTNKKNPQCESPALRSQTSLSLPLNKWSNMTSVPASRYGSPRPGRTLRIVSVSAQFSEDSFAGSRLASPASSKNLLWNCNIN